MHGFENLSTQGQETGKCVLCNAAEQHFPVISQV